MLFIRQLALLVFATIIAHADQGLKLLEKQAAAGDIDSQIELGNKFRDGSDVKTNYSKALRWYRAAAEQGDARAEYFLGLMYLNGWGVNKIWSSAVRHFKKAAEHDHTESLYELGLCYFSGKGVKQSYSKSIEYWEKASALNHTEATWRLALLHTSGESVPKSWDKARRLLEPLASSNHVPSLDLLGEIEYRSGNREKAVKHWQNARVTGSLHANELIDLSEWRSKKRTEGKFAFVEVDHIYQGWNNCVPTTFAMLLNFTGKKYTPYKLKSLCSSRRAEGTDWADLIVAAHNLGVRLDMHVFANTKEGFKEGVKLIHSSLDKGHPLVIDFTYSYGRNRMINRNGHTLLLVGYHRELDRFVLKNPYLPSPGIELISSYALEQLWHSVSYSRKAKGEIGRPLVLLR